MSILKRIGITILVILVIILGLIALPILQLILWGSIGAYIVYWIIMLILINKS